jgi:hypothetical protein
MFMQPHNSRRSDASDFSRRGQSIIEAIVAITVLTTGFLGIATLLARSLFLSRVVADQITANYLASEGIEIAKNLIDHDVYETLAGIPGYGWGRCFTYQGSNPEDVEVDYTTTQCASMSAFVIPGDPLLYDPVTHLYSYNPPFADNPVTTDFTREIRVKLNGDVIVVDSIVRWDTGAETNQSLKLEDTFYNWRL